MNPKIENYSESDNILTFTLSGVDVSFANAIRRTIISDIPTVVFKTMPYEKNKSVIIDNTSRLNNEIIKQRLSCIPINIDNHDKSLNKYLLEINEENLTDNILYVTTANFKIKNIETGEYLPENVLRKIFPPYIPPTGKDEYFIDFVRLRPKISSEILGEKIKLTCEFSISTAKDDSMFNVAGTCAYGYTPDPEQIKEELVKREQQWRDEGKTTEEIQFESSNWKLLEGLRYVKKNSFDFIIQSVGVFENDKLIDKSCDILIEKLNLLNNMMQEDNITIKPSITTMDNSYDIILENEDYTIGNILNYIIYTVFYKDTKTLSFCGFKKMHPHDPEIILRLAFNSPTAKNTIKTMFKFTIEEAVKVFTDLRSRINTKTTK